MRRELQRKLIHVSTVAGPLVVWFLPRPAGLILLGVAAGAALVVEVARRRSRFLRYHFLRRTRTMLRSAERAGLAGATYLAVAYFLALLLFPLPVAVLAMLYSGVGDAAAALVGKRWGRHRIAGGKSWEGAGAAMLVNLALGLAMPGIAPLPALIGAAAAATLEFLPLPLDDNLRVTVGGGAVLLVVTALV